MFLFVKVKYFMFPVTNGVLLAVIINIYIFTDITQLDIRKMVHFLYTVETRSIEK